MSSAIEESVGLLAVYAQRELDALRERHSAFANRLVSGQIAGDTSGESSAERQLEAEVSAAACKRVAGLCSELTDFLKCRLDRASRLEFLSQIVALVASGGLLGVLARDSESEKYFVASLAFIGSLSSLVGKFHIRTLTPGGKNAAETFQEILELRPVADQLRLEIETSKAAGLTGVASEEWRRRIGRVNEMSAKAYRLCAVVPGFRASQRSLD